MKNLFGWQQVAIMFSTLAVTTGLVSYGYGIFAVPIGQTFQASRTALMLGITGASLVSAFAAPLFGAWLDRRSIRVALTVSALFLALGLVALSLVSAMWQVILVYTVFMSIPLMAFSPVSAPILLSRWFVRQRGRALGIVMMGFSLGGILFPPLLMKLVALYEWRQTLQILGGAVLLCMVPAVFFFVIDRPSDRNTGPDGETSQAVVETAQATSHGAKTDMLRNLNFWLIAFAIGLPMSAASAVVSNLMPFALDIGIEPGRAALVLSTFAVGGLFGPMAFAALGDRVDLRVLFAASALFNVLALLGFAHAGNAEIVFGATALFAFGGSILTPLWGVLVARVFGQEHIGGVMGGMSVIVAVLCVFSPALFGAIRDQTGSYSAAFLLYAALIGLTILLISRIRMGGRPAAAVVPAAT